MDANEDAEFYFPADQAGLYGFTVPWMVGEANFTRYPFSPIAAGSAVLEVHKRPSGVYSLAGFVTQSEAEALAGLKLSQQLVDIELSTAPLAASRAAVSIPLARIDSVLLGGMGMQDVDTGASVVSLRIW
jgi:hypothetical protein